MGLITVWTRQNEAVLEQIGRDGRFIAIERYMRAEMEDCSDVMLFLYRWIAEHMPIQETRPKDAVFPVWAALSEELAYPPEKGSVLLKAAVPEDCLTCIDIVKWTTVSNYSYLPKDEADLKQHNKRMKEYGIYDAKAMMTPFYPLQKQEIMDSWTRLFDGSRPTDPGKYALLWEIRKEWIEEIIR